MILFLEETEKKVSGQYGEYGGYDFLLIKVSCVQNIHHGHDLYIIGAVCVTKVIISVLKEFGRFHPGMRSPNSKGSQ